MKIDAMSGYGVFRTNNNAAVPAKVPAAAPEALNKTDVVDFSRGQTPAPDKSLLAIKSSILRDIAQPADPEALAALREDVRAGAYRPSTDELVDAILGNR